MKKIVASAVSVALTVSLAATPDLYTLEVRNAVADNGDIVTRTFHEIERRPTSSIAEVVTDAGSSISGFEFLLRGVCGVAKARGERYFTFRPISRSPMRMEIIFLKSAPDPRSFGRLEPGKEALTTAECDLIDGASRAPRAA